MAILTNILTTVSNKPVIAVTITQSAFVVSLLAWVNVITPILGLVAAIFGVIVGYYSMRNAIKKWKEANKHKSHSKK